MTATNQPRIKLIMLARAQRDKVAIMERDLAAAIQEREELLNLLSELELGIYNRGEVGDYDRQAQ